MVLAEFKKLSTEKVDGSQAISTLPPNRAQHERFQKMIKIIGQLFIQNPPFHLHPDIFHIWKMQHFVLYLILEAAAPVLRYIITPEVQLIRNTAQLAKP